MSEITVGDTPPGGTVLGMRMVPSDADVETLRRAMVEAHQTWLALLTSMSFDPPAVSRNVHDEAEVKAERSRMIDAGRAYRAAKRARGGDRP